MNMQQTAPRTPDEKRSFDKGRLELVTLGGVTFGRLTLQPGWPDSDESLNVRDFVLASFRIRIS